jgi:hypothetical protein
MVSTRKAILRHLAEISVLKKIKKLTILILVILRSDEILYEGNPSKINHKNNYCQSNFSRLISAAIVDSDNLPEGYNQNSSKLISPDCI